MNGMQPLGVCVYMYTEKGLGLDYVVGVFFNGRVELMFYSRFMAQLLELMDAWAGNAPLHSCWGWAWG